MIAQAVKYFTEDELKELILIYQKPVMQKQYDFMLTWILGPVFSALQDPAILAQYTQEFIGFGMSMALQNNPQEIKRKGEELGKIAKGELDSLQTSVKFESPEFKEKLKNRYKSIAAIIEGLDLSKISSGIDNLSKTIDGMIDPTLKAGALPAMPDSAFPAEPMPAQ